MAERPEPERQEQLAETESFTGGPGAVGTKSQMRGAAAGIIIGAIVGALLGLALGLITDRPVVFTLVGAVAGAVVGGVAGGGQNPKQKLGTKSEADR